MSDEATKKAAIEEPDLKILTAEEIADTSRYKLEPETLPLPEIGGAVRVKPMTVEQRLALPSMRDDEGNWAPTLDAMAASFASVLIEPELTPKQAEKFIGKLPTTAYDAVQLKIAEMVGSIEEERATRKEFRPSKD